MYSLRFTRAQNDLLFDEQDRQYIDLFSGHGTTFLGHNRLAITQAVAEQLGHVWITGGVETPVLDAAKQAIEGFLPSSHRLIGLYSTGMEAAEFAIRVARHASPRNDGLLRNGVIGFERGMHGKSLATSYLCWDNHDGLQLPQFVRLPFVPQLSETEILSRLEAVLWESPISAVFLEPLQGSSGRCISREFAQDLRQICTATGALLVFDEILTGFFRTGVAFLYEQLGALPDLILIGKALGNGFPVSGVVADRRIELNNAMLPGSTFANHALAAAAVTATLREMRALQLAEMVGRIEQVIQQELKPLVSRGITPRGKGALWCLELPEGGDATKTAAAIYRRGVAIGCAGRLLRLIPAATIDLDRLRQACQIVRDEVLRG